MLAKTMDSTEIPHGVRSLTHTTAPNISTCIGARMKKTPQMTPPKACRNNGSVEAFNPQNRRRPVQGDAEVTQRKVGPDAQEMTPKLSTTPPSFSRLCSQAG